MSLTTLPTHILVLDSDYAARVLEFGQGQEPRGTQSIPLEKEFRLVCDYSFLLPLLEPTDFLFYFSG